MDNPELEDIIVRLRSLFAAQYDRGGKDQVARIMKAAGAAVKQQIERPPPVTEQQRLPPTRVARGLPDELIKKALTESPGIGPSQIRNSATGEMKDVSFSAIRFALSRGREKGIYEARDGKWYLAERSGQDRV